MQVLKCHMVEAKSKKLSFIESIFETFYHEANNFCKYNRENKLENKKVLSIKNWIFREAFCLPAANWIRQSLQTNLLLT